MSQIYASMEPTPSEYARSYAYNEFGVSLPVVESVEPTVIEQPRDMLAEVLLALSKSNMFNATQGTPTTSTTGGGLSNSQNELLASAGKNMLYGAGMKTAASAARFFTSLATYVPGMHSADLKYKNAKLQAANQMAALDNQVQYYKNQITDRFNTLLARNTMTMAAKGLRVTAGNLLDQTKDAAYDATKDMRTLESNAELKKIALRSSTKQAKIAKELEKTLLTTNLMQSGIQLGMAIMSAGGTGMAWGDLYNMAYPEASGSLNKTVYGG